MKVLITGASSGIGEALAQLCGERHFDVVLVARRKEKLNEIAIELRQKFSVEAEVIVADLTVKEQLKEVEERIDKGDIDILINNAGFGSSGPFVELDLETQLNLIDLNVKALVALSRYAAVHMVKKQKGTIVNISSLASYQPMTGSSVYGAAKSFVTSFSHALREELSSSGVNVLVVCPGMTHTEFFERSQWIESKKGESYPPFIWQTSMDVAKATFEGIDKQKGVVIPGLLNKSIAALTSSLPGTVTRKMTAYIAKGRRTR